MDSWTGKKYHAVKKTAAKTFLDTEMVKAYLGDKFPKFQKTTTYFMVITERLSGRKKKVTLPDLSKWTYAELVDALGEHCEKRKYHEKFEKHFKDTILNRSTGKK